ncbi:MAG: hypothetical protein RSE12_08640 [Fuscovulum sp.]|nr:MAG: hypothetical protein RSE12_08640 [Fuscovulum sp.]
MTKRNNPITTIDPGALRREAAAHYCGVSAVYFDRMVALGALPSPRRLGSNVRVWIKRELDQYLLTLPSAYDVDLGSDVNPCDRLLDE